MRSHRSAAQGAARSPYRAVLASDATPRCASMASADRQMIGDATLVSCHRSDVVGCAQPSERSARRIAQPIPSVLASDATPRCASMASADRQMIGDATLARCNRQPAPWQRTICAFAGSWPALRPAHPISAHSTHGLV
ncbi:hypothetical protein Veis_2362 [Verminephrobacter eiseniae EF01-2]|uniref:Uncharacterized protein n=1 Tax=Verminephrobacter eiseniae (strain EF01-2) TaxID=391735 RepID=A1WKF1_VEREI|nr:hypothetical protein Veis_2362 [Verminephrobacter eiseniae EF01-2]